MLGLYRELAEQRNQDKDKKFGLEIYHFETTVVKLVNTIPHAGYPFD
jgi:hypothetical protein